MKICVIGTGYVGLVVGTCLAEKGNNVICVDNDKNKLALLAQGIIPIYEPGLEDLIKSNVTAGRLQFSDNLKNAVQKSSICYIAVGTPQGEDGNADLKDVYEVAKSIGEFLNEYKVIVNKSTVPVGTAEKVVEIIKQQTTINFDMISNPEFLKQGAAVEDFLNPDRVIIGSNSEKATEIMKELYSSFLKNANTIIVMDIKSAEMAKYASNTFLALKISYINQIANICEKVGADIEMVRNGMCSDKRIGSQFLSPGLGFGGSCFPKDVQALLKLSEEFDCDSEIFKVIKNINKNQRELFVEKILQRFGGNLSAKTFAIWGLAFKPGTNDMREAPSVTIITNLLNLGAKIQAYDPKAAENAKVCFKDNIKYCVSSNEALENTDAMLLLTEWDEFKRPDFNKMKELMKNPVIFDGRNQYNGNYLKEIGFEYYSVGKG